MKYAGTATYFLLAGLLAGCGGTGPDPEAGLEDMLAREIAFGEHSVREGTRSAFLAFLADDSVVFEPEPADGKAAQTEGPDNGMLSWTPVYAEIAADGKFGFTTGPWTFEGEGVPGPIHGHYVSVWTVQPDGSWKVILDIGNTYPDPVTAGGPVEKRVGAEPVDIEDAQAAADELKALDRELSIAPEGAGSLMAATDPDVRMYRNGERPARGREAALELLSLTRAGEPAPEGAARWEPLGAGVAGSGDLGYTYGYAGVSAESTSYLRIWRRSPGARWKIIVDVVI